jgi:hypothetical protein
LDNSITDPEPPAMLRAMIFGAPYRINKDREAKMQKKTY